MNRLNRLLISFISVTANQMVEKDGSSLWDCFTYNVFKDRSVGVLCITVYIRQLTQLGSRLCYAALRRLITCNPSIRKCPSTYSLAQKQIVHNLSFLEKIM